MQEVDINTLVNNDYELNQIIPSNIIIVGKINNLWIEYKYDELDLSRLKCQKIYYTNQEGDSIKNYILPNSLLKLNCSYNQLTSLPNLPNSLEILCCSANQLTSLPNLPNSLKKLHCYGNQLTSLPDLPNSLESLWVEFNQLTYLPNLPNPLKFISINCIIDYIKYEPNYLEKNIEFIDYYLDGSKQKSYIEVKDYGRITSNEEYIQYMEKIKLSKIKSARK